MFLRTGSFRLRGMRPRPHSEEGICMSELLGIEQLAEKLNTSVKRCATGARLAGGARRWACSEPCGITLQPEGADLKPASATATAMPEK